MTTTAIRATHGSANRYIPDEPGMEIEARLLAELSALGALVQALRVQPAPMPYYAVAKAIKQIALAVAEQAGSLALCDGRL